MQTLKDRIDELGWAKIVLAFKHSDPRLMAMDRTLIRKGMEAALATIQEKGPN